MKKKAFRAKKKGQKVNVAKLTGEGGVSLTIPSERGEEGKTTNGNH